MSNTFREIFNEHERNLLFDCVGKIQRQYKKRQQNHYENRNDIKGAAYRAENYKEKAAELDRLLNKLSEESI